MACLFRSSSVCAVQSFASWRKPALDIAGSRRPLATISLWCRWRSRQPGEYPILSRPGIPKPGPPIAATMNGSVSIPPARQLIGLLQSSWIVGFVTGTIGQSRLAAIKPQKCPVPVSSRTQKLEEGTLELRNGYAIRDGHDRTHIGDHREPGLLWWRWVAYVVSCGCFTTREGSVKDEEWNVVRGRDMLGKQQCTVDSEGRVPARLAISRLLRDGGFKSSCVKSDGPQVFFCQMSDY